jgi:hypothetical protein
VLKVKLGFDTSVCTSIAIPITTAIIGDIFLVVKDARHFVLEGYDLR